MNVLGVEEAVKAVLETLIPLLVSLAVMNFGLEYSRRACQEGRLMSHRVLEGKAVIVLGVANKLRRWALRPCAIPDRALRARRDCAHRFPICEHAPRNFLKPERTGSPLYRQ
jgi:hypothetical protein